jgi:hypothetical protein
MPGFDHPEFGKVTDEQKNMALMCHMASLAGVVTAGLANALGPYLVWSAKKGLGPYVDAHGKEALNFQLTYLPLLLALLIVAMVTFDWVWIFVVALLIYLGVMAVLAGQKAGQGEMYRYPATIRFLK